MSLTRKCRFLISWGPVGLFLFWSTWNSGDGARLNLIPIEHVGCGGHVSVQLGFSLPHPNLLGTQCSSCSPDPRITYCCVSPGMWLLLTWVQQERELLARFVSVPSLLLIESLPRGTVTFVNILLGPLGGGVDFAAEIWSS